MQKQGPYRRKLAAALLSAVLSLAHPVLPLVTAATLITTEDAEARRSSSSSSRSSGGYSRPSSSSSSRTPSYSSGSSSSSGGYSRPGSSSTTTTRTPSLSSSDRDIARSSSGSSLQSYRSSRTPDATPSAPISSGNSYSIPRRDNAPAYSYAPPRYTYGSPSRFGIWDAAMLWFMLDSLSNSSRSSFFYNHANDPGVQQWRAEADKLATENADLKAKLGQLDQQVAAQSGQPRDENYLPPDIGMPSEPEEDGDFGWIILLGLAGFAGYVIYKRIGRRKAANENAGGSDMPLGPLKPAADILKRKFGNDGPYRPDWFRVGMPLQIDPSPFLLLGPDTALRTPPGRADVEAVSTLVGTSATIYRLYLSGTEGAFVEVSLDKSGQPSGARYFAPLDEVHPADDGEWDFWLNEDEGMIGWHEFQAKDGKTYGRMWAQGGDRVDPIKFTETRERVDGTGQRDVDAMLYGRETGLKAPAPTAEYLLVAAADTGSEAWVELFTGIDINPASLGLA